MALARPTARLRRFLWRVVLTLHPLANDDVLAGWPIEAIRTRYHHIGPANVEPVASLGLSSKRWVMASGLFPPLSKGSLTLGHELLIREVVGWKWLESP